MCLNTGSLFSLSLVPLRNFFQETCKETSNRKKEHCAKDCNSRVDVCELLEQAAAGNMSSEESCVQFLTL